MNEVKPPKPGWQLRVFPLFSYLGWILILISLILGLFVLTPTAVGYWSDIDKAGRDTAIVGSEALQQLQTLAVIPRWLEPMMFLGVGSFMVGIALLFSTIPNILKNRGYIMSACFPLIAKLGE